MCHFINRSELKGGDKMGWFKWYWELEGMIIEMPYEITMVIIGVSIILSFIAVFVLDENDNPQDNQGGMQ